jgi:penicillin-binding protein 1C
MTSTGLKRTQRISKLAGKWLWNFMRLSAGIFLVFVMLNLLFPLPSPPYYSPLLTDCDGRLLHAFLTPDEKWRMKTEPEEISPLLRKTIVAKEDRHFYRHPGINPFAVFRALANNITRGRRTSGASTITMQVARMLEPKKRNLPNKLIEAFRALQLEWKYEKDEILQLYVNMVPMGGNIEGVKAASWLYFNKNPNHLSLAEIVSLSVIPNRPNSLRIGRNNEVVVQARNKWLNQFAAQGLFTQKEIADAQNEPLTAYRHDVPRHAPHLAAKLRRNGMVNIQSTLHLQSQLKTETLVADYVRGLKWYNINNAAVLIIDNNTRQLITYVGSAGFLDTTDAGQVNGAAAVRQPGSTLKPLLYGLCIDAGLTTPKMKIDDIAVNYQGYVPENYDRTFNGTVTMEYALGHSLNIPSVRMLQLLGKDNLIETLVACGFRQIDRDRKKLGLSMILGGCGATLEELTGLFAALACEGMYKKPTVMMGDTTNKGSRILSRAACFMLNDILSNVQRPDFPVNWTATEKLPRIAWKTGTSYGRRDAWSIGYNQRYTVGVWVGNFSGAGVPELGGATIATPLLFRIFNTLDYDAGSQWYAQPADCNLRIVCTESGLAPADFCESRTSDYFIPLISPSATCNHLTPVLVSAKEDMSFCTQCAPTAGYKPKYFRNLSPEIMAWYSENHISMEKIPPHNPACQRVFADNGPKILSPGNQVEYFLSKSKPEPLLLQCRAEADVAKVYWYVNDRLYRAAHPAERVFFMPQQGGNTITCTDDKGRSQQVRILVNTIDL